MTFELDTLILKVMLSVKEANVFISNFEKKIAYSIWFH